MMTASAAAYRATCDITSKFKSCIYAWPSGADASAPYKIKIQSSFYISSGFHFQVAPLPLNPQAYAGISQGLTAFCFLISKLVH